MIKRDGANPSLWQETTEPYITQNKTSAHNYDVIVIGGGITGVTTALRLQLAGKKCLLIEASTIAFGTTSGTTAHLNTLLDTPYSAIIKDFNLDKANLIARATEEAISYIKSNVDCYTIDCGYEECDAFLFALNESQVKEMEEILESCKKVNLPVSHSEKIPVPISFVKAMSIAGQAKFNPLTYLHALARVFEKEGGVILENDRVIGVDENDSINVKTLSDNFTCDHVVYATHIPPTINPLHLELTPYRTYVIAARLGTSEYPADLAYDMNDPYHYYRSQTIDGIEYLIAGGEDHKTGEEENTQAPFRNLEAYVRKHFNIAEVTQRWSSQYYESIDGLPYIGTLPGHDQRVVVATGFGGNGMVYSAIAAKIIENIILGKENELTHAFSPSRLKPVAGFKSFVSHNADVVKNFAEKLVETTKMAGLVELAPGESTIIKLDGQHAGIYKDENGGVHAVNATCTHMGCSVRWNATEKSWDCPCHGARFSPDGKVLNGPADKDLEYINLEMILK